MDDEVSKRSLQILREKEESARIALEVQLSLVESLESANELILRALATKTDRPVQVDLEFSDYDEDAPDEYVSGEWRFWCQSAEGPKSVRLGRVMLLDSDRLRAADDYNYFEFNLDVGLIAEFPSLLKIVEERESQGREEEYAATVVVEAMAQFESRGCVALGPASVGSQDESQEHSDDVSEWVGKAVAWIFSVAFLIAGIAFVRFVIIRPLRDWFGSL